ncbi:MAG: hypothetical protein NTV49_12400 [Kiritimatiellaeota bacterium]|nr:hypothetical protein [Kiritimatiellota bacterium]
MGLLDMFRKLSVGPAEAGSRRVVIDASRWPDGRGADRQSPRDQVQALQQISRFARQEKLEAQVAFEGRALREVSEDGDYNGLKVFFAEKQGGVGDLVIRLVQRARPKGLLVFTADAALEKKVAALGAATMHLSTLRKALEGGAGREQPDGYGQQHSGDRDRGRDGGRRRFGGRPPREGNGGGGGGGGRSSGGGRGPGSAAEAGASSPQPNAAVRNLIDLVEEPVRHAPPPPAPTPQPPTPPPQAAAPIPAPEPPPQP